MNDRKVARLCGLALGGFGEADARLITIGELDPGRLECTLQRFNLQSSAPAIRLPFEPSNRVG
jgi:hypothetical protein